ncbi:MAG: nucleotide sugar dehydrogenase [Acidimicrobiales bacterium]
MSSTSALARSFTSGSDASKNHSNAVPTAIRQSQSTSEQQHAQSLREAQSQAKIASPTVAVIGLGYVGLPTALALAQAGIDVIGVDKSADRLESIRRERVDLTPADQQRLSSELKRDKLILTANADEIARADGVIVCVPTPVDDHLVPDLGPLRAACEVVVENATAAQTIILTSTSFVGTTRRLIVEPLEQRGFELGSDIWVAYSPERIDPANVSFEQSDVPRVIGGFTAECERRAADIVGAIAPVCRVGSLETAEMTKLYENTFRAVNIALANEMAEIASVLNIDPVAVVDAAATKPFGFMAFYPGPGVGGHCIPCDPHYLLWQLRAERKAAPLIDQAMSNIAERPGRIVDMIEQRLAQQGRAVDGAKILIHGTSYKPGVADVRESPALEIMERLRKAGARVAYHDEHVPSLRLGSEEFTSLVSPERFEFDLIVVHTVHPEDQLEWLSERETFDATFRLGATLRKAA